MDEQAEAIEYGYPEHFWYETTQGILYWRARCICGAEWVATKKGLVEWGVALHVSLMTDEVPV